jgi:hypothetical protein
VNALRKAADLEESDKSFISYTELVARKTALKNTDITNEHAPKKSKKEQIDKKDKKTPQNKTESENVGKS